MSSVTLCWIPCFLALLSLAVAATIQRHHRPDHHGSTTPPKENDGLHVAINWGPRFTKLSNNVMMARKGGIWSYFTLANAPALFGVAEEAVGVLATIGSFFMSNIKLSYGH